MIGGGALLPPPKAAKKYVFSRREPEIPSELQTTAEWPSDHDIEIAEQHISGAEARGRQSGSLRIESSILERVTLAESAFHTILLKDVRLIGCDLANLRVRGLELIRVSFLDCRMTGLNGGETQARDVFISGGDQRYTQFRFSRFKSSEFDSANFEDADFQGTDLSGAKVRACNLRNADFTKARLNEADLRGSTVEGLHIGMEGLRGAIVDPSQAMHFALLLGIRIE